MAQRFLLTAAARTLSVASVARMSEGEARETFRKIRWADTDGEPVCPRCGCVACSSYASRPIFRCKACGHQFSVTSGTIFASRKRPVRDYLLAIAIFVNGAKGVSARQLARDLRCRYMTAFVLAHKLREAMRAEHPDRTPSGHVEIDGAYFGGHIRQENRKGDRVDRRLAEHQTGKRRAVVALRERGGRTLPFVVAAEEDAVPIVRKVVAVGSTVYADEAPGWDALHASYEAKRINHSVAFVDQDARTNQAESFFSRLRLQPAPAGGDRPAPSHQRAVPAPVRRGNGVARGDPTAAERDAVRADRCGGAGASGVAGLARVLAAGPIAAHRGTA